MFFLSNFPRFRQKAIDNKSKIRYNNIVILELYSEIWPYIFYHIASLFSSVYCALCNVLTCEADAFGKRKMCVNISEYRNKYACVAQLVVQLIRNEQVAGSSPVTSSSINHIDTPFARNCKRRLFSFFCCLLATVKEIKFNSILMP